MLHALILSVTLTQTVGVIQNTDKVMLSGAQQTALGNHIAARWPVTLANVIAFECIKERETCNQILLSDPPEVQCTPAHVECSPTVSESITSATVWNMLLSGMGIPCGLVGGTRQRRLNALTYVGSDLTALATFTASLWPSVSGAPLNLYLQRDSGGVSAQMRYCAQFTQAQAWTAVQDGQSLEPCP